MIRKAMMTIYMVRDADDDLRVEIDPSQQYTELEPNEAVQVSHQALTLLARVFAADADAFDRLIEAEAEEEDRDDQNDPEIVWRN